MPYTGQTCRKVSETRGAAVMFRETAGSRAILHSPLNGGWTKEQTFLLQAPKTYFIIVGIYWYEGF